MSHEPAQEEREPVAQAAARWFVRLQDEAATGDDWIAFEAWLAAAPPHAQAYDRVEALWLELDEKGPDIVAALDAPVPLAAHRQRRSHRAQVTRRWWLAAGAALAASVAVAVLGVGDWPGAPTQRFVTAAGQTRQFTLADGTRVWLNAGSHMDVRLERGARQVQMADGEAVFDVAHDPSRPFLIETGDRLVRVVGTEFNVRQRGDDFALTVRRGVVEVRPSGAPNAAPTRVAAGERLVHHRSSGHAVLSTEGQDGAFAWTRGQLVYSDAPLSEVAADLSRSLGAPIRVADPATGALRFSGVLELDDKDAVLRRLEAFAPVRAERSVRGVVLHRR
jgi:transmembrane sensor